MRTAVQPRLRHGRPIGKTPLPSLRSFGFPGLVTRRLESAVNERPYYIGGGPFLQVVLP